MTQMKAYILSIVATATICAIINGLLSKGNTYSSLIKLLCGVYLVVAIVAPWKSFRFDTIADFKDKTENAAASVVDEGIESSKQAAGKIIKEKTEAYILDKASSLGTKIDVEVTLSDTDIPIPEMVTISGVVSPYAKQKLSRNIASELDIPEEKQTWN